MIWKAPAAQVSMACLSIGKAIKSSRTVFKQMAGHAFSAALKISLDASLFCNILSPPSALLKQGRHKVFCAALKRAIYNFCRWSGFKVEFDDVGAGRFGHRRE